MKQKGSWIPLFLLVFLASGAGLWAGNKYKVLNGPDNFYFGHISYTEVKSDGKDPVVIREGQAAAEVAVLNLPVGPGDTIRTTADRRCEIQFDTGTIIRLDVDTELKIETILAQSLSASTQLSNLVLSRGRIYLMYRQYHSREMFQVLTPIAAVKMSHMTVATIRAAADGSIDAQVKYGKASVLFGPDERAVKKQDIKKSERLIVLGPSQVQRTAYLADTDFELWNNEINARFGELHKGQSALPKPIQKLPEAVFYFAQQYGYTYGEWIWDSLYGYVWRPFLDDHLYPWGWGPYIYGNWTSVGGQLFWVPQEPWGWIPYHLGIWQWDEKLGWVWLPGSLFAPAWVDWAFFFGHFGWRPWGLFDWFDDYYTDFGYLNGSWSYGWLGGFGGGVWPDTGGPPLTGGKPTLGVIPRSQLQKPGSAFPIPRELKSSVKNALAAYNRGDERILGSMKQAPSHAVFVAKADLDRPKIQDRAMTFDKVPKLAGFPGTKPGPATVRKSADIRLEAARTFRGNEAVRQLLHKAEVTGRVQKPEARPPVPHVSVYRGEMAGQRQPAAGGSRSIQTSGPGGHSRFLDWNPDIKVARSLGVGIEYVSRHNEIRCPELRLSSIDRTRGQDGFVARMTSSGVVNEPAGSTGSGGSGGSGGGYAGSGAGASSASHGSGGAVHGSTSGGSSSSAGGGGAIKN